MTASALLEFDLIDPTPVKLFETLCKIWAKSKYGSSVELINKFDRNIYFTSDKPPSKEDEIAIAEIKNVADNSFRQIIGTIEEKLKEKGLDTTEEPINDNIEVKESGKEWECVLSYYYDEDFPFFKSVVEQILISAKGDVFYFREPEAQGSTDCDNPKEITIDQLIDYTPNMEDWNTYVFKKN